MFAARCRVWSVTFPSLGSSRRPTWLRLVFIRCANRLREWPAGMPLCRSLGDGLWEVRSTLPGNRIARVLFSVHQGRILALHGFIRKARKTPDDDPALTRRRKREFES